jgi:hypothetical protein
MQPNLSHKPLSKIADQLGFEVLEVILGTLLGDGSLKIQKNYRNARLSFRHSLLQKEWFDYKAEVLKSLTSTKNTWVQKADGFSTIPKLRWQSKALPVLTELHSVLTSDNQIEIRRSWLNFLTARSLMVWWCDDGSLCRGDQGMFSTHGFSKKQCDILVQYLLKVWNVRCVTKIRKTKQHAIKTYWVIVIADLDNLFRFLRLILPHLPCQMMLYKFIPVLKCSLKENKNTQLQERWISEIKQIHPQYKHQIDTYVQEKIKYKFRE